MFLVLSFKIPSKYDIIGFPQTSETTRCEQGVEGEGWKVQDEKFSPLILLDISSRILSTSPKSIVFAESNLTYLTGKLFARYRCRLSFHFPSSTRSWRKIFSIILLLSLLLNQRKVERYFFSLPFFSGSNLNFFLFFLVCNFSCLFER